MFEKILGKKSKNENTGEIDPQIVEKISKMNLSDMRLYLKNGIKDFQVCSAGLVAVMKRLTTPINDKEEYYLKEDDMDTKKKKAFDLVLLIGKSKSITIEVVEMMNSFVEIYKEMIDKYDTEHKDIYYSRFKKAIESAIINVHTITQVQKQLDILK